MSTINPQNVFRFFLMLYFYLAAHQAKATMLLMGSAPEAIGKAFSLEIKNQPIAGEAVNYAIPIAADGSFAVEIEAASLLCNLVMEGEKQPVYLEPGDTLFVLVTRPEFSTGVYFGGNAAPENRFLYELNQHFERWNDMVIMHEMIQKAPMDFEIMMDKLLSEKWDFYKKYNPKEIDKFSPGFATFFSDLLSYWHANELLYYVKLKSGENGLYDVSNIPGAYFSFLNNIMISNDLALNNPFYIRFVHQYLQLRRDNLFKNDNPFIIPDGREIMVNQKKYKLLSAPKDSKNQPFYVIKGNAGDTVWISQNNGKIVATQLDTLPVEMQKEQVEVTRIQNIAIAAWDELTLWDRPETARPVTTVARGVEMESMNHETQDLFEYKRGDVLYHDQLIRVRTAAGIEGWVPKNAVIMEEKALTYTELRQSPDTDSESCYNGLNHFLQGKTLYYFVANEMFETCPLFQQEDFEPKIQHFNQVNPFPEFTSFVSEFWESAKLSGQSGFVSVKVPDGYHLIFREEHNSALHQSLLAKALQQKDINGWSFSPENTQETGAFPVGLVAGEKAPDFDVVDFYGNHLRLSDLKGKLVLLDFWASWCNPCLINIAQQQTYLPQFDPGQLVVMYVSIDKDPGAWMTTLKENDWKGYQVLDTRNELSLNYQVDFIPALYLIKDGNIVYNSKDSGASKLTLQERIQKLMAN